MLDADAIFSYALLKVFRCGQPCILRRFEMFLPGKQPRSFSRWPFLTAAATVWICLVGLPQSANATCGDYLMPAEPWHSGWSHQSEHRDYYQGHPSTALPGHSETPAPPSSDPRPCRGPMCSRGDVPGLPSAPIPETRFSPERWAFVALNSILPDNTVRLLTGEHPQAESLLLGSGIYRPPRPAALCG